ncbi:hypothetical protein R6Z02_17375 [Carnobacterium maltaromaticum]|uniref:hypothetical protein n=1 Tax=Carnobacterium maltaromaticum TaxID=2751 RepID=UPI00298ADE8E|nr:hypothetical protein [Carnobacterium maltaromaticum]MDW5525510.1 hypothetical protein [Carnobacterium maltaromaticum]
MNLFTDLVSEDKQHANYKMIKNENDKVKVISDWANGFVDRDNKFVKEFQTTFNSSFWELYLNAVFRKLNLKIDFNYSAPDFLIKSSITNQEFIVEATTTNAPSGGVPEHDGKLKSEQWLRVAKNEEDLNNVTDLAEERIANSIRGKLEKYKKSYQHLDHVKDKPFVIALGGYEQPLFFQSGTGPINKVLYGITGHEIDIETGEPELLYGNTIIKKSNQSEIPIGIFTNDSYKEVSAIIYSNLATAGKVNALSEGKNKYTFSVKKFNANSDLPTFSIINGEDYKEDLLNGLHVFLNPYAEIEFNLEDFVNENILLSITPELTLVDSGFLYSRNCMNVEMLSQKS